MRIDDFTGFGGHIDAPDFLSAKDALTYHQRQQNIPEALKDEGLGVNATFWAAWPLLTLHLTTLPDKDGKSKPLKITEKDALSLNYPSEVAWSVYRQFIPIARAALGLTKKKSLPLSSTT